jgi:hypothetical protein
LAARALYSRNLYFTSLLNLYGLLRRRYEAWSYHSNSVFQIQEGNDFIRSVLHKGLPSAMGKIGSSELLALRHYLKTRKENNRDVIWEKHRKELYVNAGVFPPVGAVFDRWVETFLEAIRHVTVLGVWFHAGEAKIVKKYCSSGRLVPIRSLEPYYSNEPWSEVLSGKRVLVLHPFVDTINKQCQRRLEIWPGQPEILPAFELMTIKTPLSAARVKSPFSDWFETVSYLKSRMESLTFDVAVVGAGAYSLPLVVHARKLGKIGIHLGGATQILFGIKGLRWDRHPVISTFYNSAWRRPSNEETPQENFDPEVGGYW